MSDPNIDLEHVYIFNVPVELQALDKTLSKYRGTKLEISAEDILECIIYLIATGEGFIDTGEVYEYVDNLAGYEANDPDHDLAIEDRDMHEIIHIAECILRSEGDLITNEIKRASSRHQVELYFTRVSRIRRTSLVEIRLQYQRTEARA